MPFALVNLPYVLVTCTNFILTNYTEHSVCKKESHAVFTGTLVASCVSCFSFLYRHDGKFLLVSANQVLSAWSNCKIKSTMMQKMSLWNTDTPGSSKVQNDYFQYKGHGQCRKIIGHGGIWKGSIGWVCMEKSDVSIYYGSKRMPENKVFPTKSKSDQN